jgi:hypothetical protein
MAFSCSEGDPDTEDVFQLNRFSLVSRTISTNESSPGLTLRQMIGSKLECPGVDSDDMRQTTQERESQKKPPPSV